jgi:hypothetical protein
VKQFGVAIPLLRVIQSRYRNAPSLPDPAYLVLRRDEAVLHLSSFPGDALIGHAVTIAVRAIEALHGHLASNAGATGKQVGNREL